MDDDTEKDARSINREKRETIEEQKKARAESRLKRLKDKIESLHKDDPDIYPTW